MSSSGSPKDIILHSTVPAGSALPPVNLSLQADDKVETVLFVCPFDDSRRLIAAAIKNEGYRVVMVDSLEEALTELEEQNITRMLVDSRFSDWQNELASAVRKSATNCTTVTLDSITGGIFDSPEPSIGNTLAHMSGLHLAVAALASRSEKSAQDDIRIGPYVERLAERLNLSRDNHLIACSVAYLLDIMQMLKPREQRPDYVQALFELSGLAGEGYILPPLVVNLVRRMYQPMDNYIGVEHIPQDVLLANILSISDFFCRSFSAKQRMSRNLYITIERYLSVHLGTLFLAEVVKNFLDILKEEIEHSSDRRKNPLVMLYNTLGDIGMSIETRLYNAGFDSTLVSSASELSEQLGQVSPDMIFLALSGSYDEALVQVHKLVSSGVSVHRIPTFVLLNDRAKCNLVEFLRLGIEDAATPIEQLDALIVKAQRVWEVREKESRQRLEVLQDMGTHGSLTDMSLIDLLQAMGTGEKIFLVNVSAQGQQLILTIGKNRIFNAECGDLYGERAIFEALKWEHGIWSVDPINQETEPDQHISRSIDSILIEGCYLLDQEKHDA